MKIGFDIDDTLINLREHAFEIYKRKLNIDVPSEQFYELNRVEIHELFGLTDEQGNNMWNRSLEEIYYTECPPYDGAIETLKELMAEGHEIYYITARPKEHGERTKEWMKKKGFPIEDTRFFYGMQDHEKVNFIKELQLDYYVDDKPAILETLSQESVQPLLKDQSYNRNYPGPRIFHWYELKTFLKNK
ncbi:5' nucleotidase, NT5C type [Bacillus suaedaesalsae]|uniref:Nucleotidase n=1 Tax=Bacillus suaedaesalsae TaxID=2810349 RepID=A0ABS2DMK3_9BACI|nr:HAD family acid phosphatase [Bacillus suaedaesalsae]MBM6619290.1 HAD hydrolase-like protein [Bacillus suaedaesalsae]